MFNRSRTDTRGGHAPYENRGGRPPFIHHQNTVKSIVENWRKAMSVVVTDSEGYDQIEIRSFIKKYDAMQWQKQFFFKNVKDFDSFIEFLSEAADKIEDDKLLKNPAPESKDPLPETETKREDVVIDSRFDLMDVAVTDNRGFDQIEVRLKNRAKGFWRKVFYFRNIDDFDDFIKSLESAVEKIKTANLVTNERPKVQRFDRPARAEVE